MPSRHNCLAIIPYPFQCALFPISNFAPDKGLPSAQSIVANSRYEIPSSPLAHTRPPLDPASTLQMGWGSFSYCTYELNTSLHLFSGPKDCPATPSDPRMMSICFKLIPNREEHRKGNMQVLTQCSSTFSGIARKGWPLSPTPLLITTLNGLLPRRRYV